MNEIPYSVEDFLDKVYCGSIPITHKGGREEYIDCFYCSAKAKDRCASIVLYGDKAHLYSCLKCGARANTRKIVRDLYNESAERLILGDDAFKNKRQEIRAKEKENTLPTADLAPINQRNLVNNKILDLLKLSDEDLGNESIPKSLIGRGFSLSEVNRLKYKTINFNTYDQIETFSKVLREEVGSKMKGVCGAYQGKDGNYKMYFPLNNPSILIPYRNRFKEIEGFQIRVRKVKGEKGLRYFWLSSSNKFNGCGTGNFVHYATDFLYDFRKNKEVADIKSTIIITEGALKGDLAHFYSHLPFMCVGGVNNIGKIKSELLSWNGQIKNVVCAYDMDYLTNSNVQRAEENLKNLVNSAGCEYYRAYWDTRFKGIDDFFVSCKGNFAGTFNKETHEVKFVAKEG